MGDVDIAEFLTAQYQDEEDYARNAAEHYGADWIEIWSGTVDLCANLPERDPGDGDSHVPTGDSSISRFMVRHDPTHVLADIAAKRLLLKVHTGDHICAGWEGESYFDDGPCLTACLMAAPYDARPDYSPDWIVEA